MSSRVKTEVCGAALAACLLLAGCSGQSSTKNNSKESSGTSKDSGKTYTPDSKGGKGGQGAGASGSGGSQSGGGSGTAALPSPADTVNYQPSAASDAGLSTADQGAAIMNPGAPVAHGPAKPKGK